MIHSLRVNIVLELFYSLLCGGPQLHT